MKEPHIHYLLIDKRTTGPYTESEVRDLISRGKIDIHTSYWEDGTSSWIPLGQSSFSSSMQALQVVSKKSKSIQTIALILWTFFAVWILATTFMEPFDNFMKGITEGIENKISESSNTADIELVDFSIDWYKGHGQYAFPKVETSIKNNLSKTIDHYRLKVVFYDDKGVIRSDPYELVGEVPPGRTKGPIFLQSSIGVNDITVIKMASGEAAKWEYEIFYSRSFLNDKWIKIKSGEILTGFEHLYQKDRQTTQ